MVVEGRKKSCKCNFVRELRWRVVGNEYFFSLCLALYAAHHHQQGKREKRELAMKLIVEATMARNCTADESVVNCTVGSEGKMEVEANGRRFLVGL